MLLMFVNSCSWLHDSSKTTINPFTTVDTIWRLEFITHMAVCLTFADKYFYASQHSMCLF